MISPATSEFWEACTEPEMTEMPETSERATTEGAATEAEGRKEGDLTESFSRVHG